MYVDILAQEKPWRDVYRLCVGFITPRPIALISTVSPHGVPNLAPYSFYNMVCANPPVVMACPTIRRTGADKDTLANICAIQEFVIATVTAELAEPMNACGADLPPERSEFEFSGLTPAPATLVRPPLVKESPVNIECRLREIKHIGEGPGSVNIVFGDLVAIHVDDRILGDDGWPDPRRFTTVGRLGGNWYANADTPYEMHIPSPPAESS